MAKYDKRIKILVKNIAENSTAYIDYIKTIGNPCASTDRVIEEIIRLGEELKKTYDRQW